MADEQFLTAIIQLKDKNFTAGLKKGYQELAKFRKSIVTAAKESNRFGNNTTSSFKRASNGASSLTKTVIGLTTALLGLKAVDWAKDQVLGGVEAASSLEGYRLTLETVMKSSKKAGDLMKWASNFANVTPFETDAVVEGTVRLQSYGVEAKKTLPIIGDMAAVMGKDLMQAVEAVADAQTGELERMKEFGITKTMLQKKSNEMFKKGEVIDKKGHIVDQEKFNKVLFKIMNERFKGGMEKQSKTFKGITSNITGTWKTGLAEMVGVTTDGTIRQGSLFEKLKKKADEVAKKLSEWSKDGTFKKIGDKMSDMYDKFEKKIPAIKQFFEDMKAPMGVVKDVLTDIGKGFMAIVKFANEHPDIAKAIGLTAAGAAVAKKTGLLSVLDALGKGFSIGSPTIKAAVVNVYGAKVNGGGGDIPTPGGGGGGKPPTGKPPTMLEKGKNLLPKVAPFLGKLGPTALTTGVIATTFFAGNNFDKAKEDPNSIYSSKVYSNSNIERNHQDKQQYFMGGPNANTVMTDKQVKGLETYLTDGKTFEGGLGYLKDMSQNLGLISQNPPQQNVTVNLNMGGVTVGPEWDMNNFVANMMNEVKKHTPNIAPSAPSVKGKASPGRW